MQDRNELGLVTATYLNGPGVDNKIPQTGLTGAFYYLSDHLGSTTALTDALGNVVEQQAYDTFGNSAGSTLTRYGYTGRERDADTGRYYYRARWYDPQAGRFISEDPNGLEGGINLYAYVENDPLTFTDPLGHQDVGYAERTRPGDVEWAAELRRDGKLASASNTTTLYRSGLSDRSNLGLCRELLKHEKGQHNRCR